MFEKTTTDAWASPWTNEIRIPEGGAPGQEFVMTPQVILRCSQVGALLLDGSVSEPATWLRSVDEVKLAHQELIAGCF